MGGIGIWQLIIILAIVLVVFGTKKFRNIGSDLGNAIKGFKKSVANEEDKKITTEKVADETIDVEVVETKEPKK